MRKEKQTSADKEWEALLPSQTGMCHPLPVRVAQQEEQHTEVTFRDHDHLPEQRQGRYAHKSTEDVSAGIPSPGPCLPRVPHKHVHENTQGHGVWMCPSSQDHCKDGAEVLGQQEHQHGHSPLWWPPVPTLPDKMRAAEASELTIALSYQADPPRPLLALTTQVWQPSENAMPRAGRGLLRKADTGPRGEAGPLLTLAEPVHCTSSGFRSCLLTAAQLEDSAQGTRQTIQAG